MWHNKSKRSKNNQTTLALLRTNRKVSLSVVIKPPHYIYSSKLLSRARKVARKKKAPFIFLERPYLLNYHGLKAGMGKSQAEEAKAVECGYWHLWRYNPQLEAEGKNPFSLDSKEPQWDKFQDYLKGEVLNLKGEVRFASVAKQFPKEADELFAAAQENAQWRYKSYLRMLGTQW